MSETHPEFEIGNKARQKSGGPIMTVKEVEINIITLEYWNPTAMKYDKYVTDFAMLDKID